MQSIVKSFIDIRWTQVTYKALLTSIENRGAKVVKKSKTINTETNSKKRLNMIPSKKKKTQRKPSTAVTKKVEMDKSDDNYECLVCGEWRLDSRPGESWIQCVRCTVWCHEDCCSFLKTSEFVCDLCLTS